MRIRMELIKVVLLEGIGVCGSPVLHIEPELLQTGFLLDALGIWLLGWRLPSVAIQVARVGYPRSMSISII